MGNAQSNCCCFVWANKIDENNEETPILKNGKINKNKDENEILITPTRIISASSLNSLKSIEEIENTENTEFPENTENPEKTEQNVEQSELENDLNKENEMSELNDELVFEPPVVAESEVAPEIVNQENKAAETQQSKDDLISNENEKSIAETEEAEKEAFINCELSLFYEIYSTPRSLILSNYHCNLTKFLNLPTTENTFYFLRFKLVSHLCKFESISDAPEKSLNQQQHQSSVTLDKFAVSSQTSISTISTNTRSESSRSKAKISTETLFQKLTHDSIAMSTSVPLREMLAEWDEQCYLACDDGQIKSVTLQIALIRVGLIDQVYQMNSGADKFWGAQSVAAANLRLSNINLSTKSPIQLKLYPTIQINDLNGEMWLYLRFDRIKNKFICEVREIRNLILSRWMLKENSIVELSISANLYHNEQLIQNKNFGPRKLRAPILQKMQISHKFKFKNPIQLKKTAEANFKNLQNIAIIIQLNQISNSKSRIISEVRLEPKKSSKLSNASSASSAEASQEEDVRHNASAYWTYFIQNNLKDLHHGRFPLK